MESGVGKCQNPNTRSSRFKTKFVTIAFSSLCTRLSTKASSDSYRHEVWSTRTAFCFAWTFNNRLFNDEYDWISAVECDCWSPKCKLWAILCFETPKLAISSSLHGSSRPHALSPFHSRIHDFCLFTFSCSIALRLLQNKVVKSNAMIRTQTWVFYVFKNCQQLPDGFVESSCIAVYLEICYSFGREYICIAALMPRANILSI